MSEDEIFDMIKTTFDRQEKETVIEYLSALLSKLISDGVSVSVVNFEPEYIEYVKDDGFIKMEYAKYNKSPIRDTLSIDFANHDKNVRCEMERGILEKFHCPKKDGIGFDGMGFFKHGKKFADEIEKLKSQLDRKQTEINELKRELEKEKDESKSWIEKYSRSIPLLYGYGINEIAKSIFEYCNQNAERFSNKNRFDYSKESEEIAKTANAIYIQALIKCLQGLCNGENYTEDIILSKFLSAEPIEVANMLINAKRQPTIEEIIQCNVTGIRTTHKFEKSRIRKIAEHLLVYCNENESEVENVE